MTFIDERSIIEGYFLSNWNADETPVKLDNIQGLTTSKGRIDTETSLDEYCALSILPGSARQVDMNAAHRVRCVGTINVNVFVKSGTGTQRARALAELIWSLFETKDLAENFATRTGSITNIGQVSGSSFYQINVSIPYYFDRFSS